MTLHGLATRAFSVVVVLTILAVAAPARAAAQGIGIEVGQPAPSALVETLDGRPVDLATVTAQGPTLIEFWAVWCPVCRALEPRVRAAQAKYGKQMRFVSVAVSVNESRERVKRHVAAHNTPGEHYFDRSGKAADAYDVPATSYVVVVDRKGKVVYTGLGEGQDLEAAVRKGL
ncbi:MAG TPA: TlpA disulfide reductase family protein [Longimicrobiales bacterium]|nr:TlpA disulfide reductase family protein [Longimicrobiales bacterium]